LITFYELERARKAAYQNAVAKHEDYRPYAYFDLAPTLFGAFTLELKVIDSAGIGSGTATDSKHVSDATHSYTWHFGPTLSGQGTHDLIWTFLMKQDAKLAGSDRNKEACFKVPWNTLPDLERLAESPLSEEAQFKRIMVDFVKPLAAWLRDNGTLISSSYLDPVNKSEGAEPAQMYYSFAVQVIGGLEVKYSLLSPQWNPWAVQGTASGQQNSNLQIYINGDGSIYANAAKSGTAGFGPTKPQLGSAENPMYVRPGVGEAQIQSEERKADTRRRRYPPPKGYLLAPLPVLPPTPSQ
jgi:hypothetical protein